LEESDLASIGRVGYLQLLLTKMENVRVFMLKIGYRMKKIDQPIGFVCEDFAAWKIWIFLYTPRNYLQQVHF
jgi:hypothetical protein